MVETMRWPKASSSDIVDRRRQDAVARCNFAIDRDVEHRPGILLIGGDVGDLGQGLELVEEDRGPMTEFVGVGVVQRVLILCLVQPRADGDVLRRLHI